MKVKKGYKQTEFGIIPEDWKVASIGDLTNIDQDNLNSATKPDYRIKYISLEDVDSGILRKFTEVQFKNAPSRARRQVKKNDILISTVRPNLKSHLFFKEEESNWVSSTGFSVLRCKDSVQPEYIFYHFFSSIINKQIDSIVTGSNYPAINSRDVKALKIPVPPKIEEQKAITNALTEADSLIDNLQKLITKKQNIKQATMQVLLTGKKRLRGFKGDWKLTVLNQIGNTYGGLSGKTKEDFEDGKYPYITFMNVMSNPIVDTSIFEMFKLLPGENQNRVQKGDLLFNGSSETPEEVGMCSVMLKEIPDLYLNSFCFGFRLKRSFDNDALYLSYYFRSNEGRKLFYSLAQGATRYNLSKSNFLQLKIPLPNVEEQKAIAAVFLDIDNELLMLKKQLSKYMSMKQGTMQSLLTGKVRLI